MLTVQSLLDELDLGLAAGAKRRRRAGALGPHLRAAGPDAVALGRRADADHRDPARHRRQAALLRPPPRRPQPRRARLRHRLQPRRAAEGAGRGGGETRLPALRGPLLDAVHRDHREGLRPPRQRAVRGAAAGDRGAAAARAAGARGARPGGDRGDDRLARSAAPWRSSTAAASGSPAAASAASSRPRRSPGSAARRSATPATATPSSPRTPRSPAGRWPTRWSRRAAAPPQAWVVIVRDSGGLGDFERLILQQAVAVVALELMRRRVARETERRLAGDVVAAALGGRMDATELRRRLEPFGIGEEAAVLVFALEHAGDGGRGAGAGARRRRLPRGRRPLRRRRPRAALRRRRRRRPRPGRGRRPRRGAALAGERGAVRAAASRTAAPESLRHAFHEARCALEATAFDNGSAPEVASWRDLGAFTLLLSIQDDEALDALLRQRARPDRARRRGVRRRAAALAGGLHRAERPVGAGGPRGLLPPPHAALPDAQGRGADRARPLARPRPDRVLAGPAGAGAGGCT